MKFSKKLLVAGLLAVVTLSATALGEILSVPSVGIQTIGQAMMSAKFGDSILVSDGVYREHVFIKAGVSLKAKNTFKAVIDGKGKGRWSRLALILLFMGSKSEMVQ